MAHSPPPPLPIHLLRVHSSPLSAISFSEDNERLYSGDSSGVVVVTSTRSLRAITSWKAHRDGILGVEEWDGRVITHARDNKLHVWARLQELPASARLGGSFLQSDLPIPTLRYSMDVNALNYCRFSLLKLPLFGAQSDEDAKGLIALPNLIDSSVADIWTLPSCERLHAAIGQAGRKSIFSSEGGESPKTGIIMSLHLFSVPTELPLSGTSSSHPADELRLICAYESGEVILRRYSRLHKATSVEGAGWEVIWNVKLHVESIMAMRVSKANDVAFTVSADHLIGRYDLSATEERASVACVAHRTKHPGNSSIALRDDGKVCAVGGWDGTIRLYSARTFKPLGTLRYHRSTCQVVEFSRSVEVTVASTLLERALDDDSEDETSAVERVDRTRWLVAGAKDHRVSIWSLISFQKG